MISIDERDYVAVICEGHAEAEVMNLLIEGDCLVFGRDQLVGEKVLSSRYFRDPKRFSDQYLTMDYEGGKVHVLLIQDRKNAKYGLKGPYLDKLSGLSYVVTAPENEMLMIHSLGLYGAYKKRSSKVKPSVFLSEATKTKTAKIKSVGYIRDFYSSHDLPAAVREHKSKSQKLGRDEIFLADLLR